jgi:tRNA ligase
MSTSVSSSTSTPSYSSSAAIGDSELIDSLLQLSKKSPKLVKSTEAAVPGCEEITVRSWKMNEFKYYDIPSPFPTLARGLFTTDADDVDEEVKHRIVIRGYDKFFNIGEVPWTTVCDIPSLLI